MPASPTWRTGTPARTTGKLYEHSAVCVHLGRVVRFDPAEKTWNYPCHGTRYDARDGHVVNGPANEGLTKAEARE